MCCRTLKASSNMAIILGGNYENLVVILTIILKKGRFWNQKCSQCNGLKYAKKCDLGNLHCLPSKKLNPTIFWIFFNGVTHKGPAEWRKNLKKRWFLVFEIGNRATTSLYTHYLLHYFSMLSHCCHIHNIAYISSSLFIFYIYWYFVFKRHMTDLLCFLCNRNKNLDFQP